jgi:hypothetical protein
MNELKLDCFYSVQAAFRRSMQEFADPMDAELQQWHNTLKLYSGELQALVTLRQTGGKPGVSHHTPACIELQVRCAETDRLQAFYFMEDLTNLIETSLLEVAPGLSLERHFLSPRDLRAHTQHPSVFVPDTIMRMQLAEKVRRAQCPCNQIHAYAYRYTFATTMTKMNCSRMSCASGVTSSHKYSNLASTLVSNSFR